MRALYVWAPALACQVVLPYKPFMLSASTQSPEPRNHAHIHSRMAGINYAITPTPTPQHHMFSYTPPQAKETWEMSDIEKAHAAKQRKDKGNA